MPAHCFHAQPCHAMPCNAVLCPAMPCHAMQRRAMPCCAMPCHAMPAHASHVQLIVPCHDSTTLLDCPNLAEGQGGGASTTAALGAGHALGCVSMPRHGMRVHGCMPASTPMLWLAMALLPHGAINPVSLAFTARLVVLRTAVCAAETHVSTCIGCISLPLLAQAVCSQAVCSQRAACARRCCPISLEPARHADTAHHHLHGISQAAAPAAASLRSCAEWGSGGPTRIPDRAEAGKAHLATAAGASCYLRSLLLHSACKVLLWCRTAWPGVPLPPHCSVEYPSAPISCCLAIYLQALGRAQRSGRAPAPTPTPPQCRVMRPAWLARPTGTRARRRAA